MYVVFHTNFVSYTNKRLSNRRGTARRPVSIEILSMATQLKNAYEKACRKTEVTRGYQNCHYSIGHSRCQFLLVICSNNACVFPDITAFYPHDASWRGCQYCCRRVCLSVCSFVTSRFSTETAKRRIMQTTPNDRLAQGLKFSGAENLGKTQARSPPTEAPNAGIS